MSPLLYHTDAATCVHRTFVAHEQIVPETPIMVNDASAHYRCLHQRCSSLSTLNACLRKIAIGNVLIVTIEQAATSTPITVNDASAHYRCSHQRCPSLSTETNITMNACRMKLAIGNPKLSSKSRRGREDPCLRIAPHGTKHCKLKASPPPSATLLIYLYLCECNRIVYRTLSSPSNKIFLPTPTMANDASAHYRCLHQRCSSLSTETNIALNACQRKLAIGNALGILGGRHGRSILRTMIFSAASLHEQKLRGIAPSYYMPALSCPTLLAGGGRAGSTAALSLACQANRTATPAIRTGPPSFASLFALTGPPPFPLFRSGGSPHLAKHFTNSGCSL